MGLKYVAFGLAATCWGGGVKNYNDIEKLETDTGLDQDNNN